MTQAQVRSSMSIRIGTNPVQLDHRSQPMVFNIDVVGIKGPSPGAILVSVTGTDVDLSELVVPGLCRFMNLDDDNFFEYGIFDPDTSTFYPLGEVGPGHFYVLHLSRNLAWQYGTGTGTGTSPGEGETNRLRLKADTAPLNALVEAFEVYPTNL